MAFYDVFLASLVFLTGHSSGKKRKTKQKIQIKKKTFSSSLTTTLSFSSFFSHVTDSSIDRVMAIVRPLLVDKKMFEHIRRRGKSVFMLGVNDEATLALSVSSGCQAVLTDRVEWLNEKTMEMKKAGEEEKRRRKKEQ